MKRLRHHLTGIDQGSLILFADFEDNGPMWAGDGPREARQPVAFSEPFRSPPAVQVGLSMWDIADGTNQRADIKAENITPEGFDLVFRTWADTRIARVRADWMAIGEVADAGDWDVG